MSKYAIKCPFCFKTLFPVNKLDDGSFIYTCRECGAEIKRPPDDEDINEHYFRLDF